MKSFYSLYLFIEGGQLLSVRSDTEQLVLVASCGGIVNKTHMFCRHLVPVSLFLFDLFINSYYGYTLHT